jgi:phenylalanyl-tRNA synthetase beta chain
MKISEIWLREWVNPTLTREQLCEKLTMSGLEVDGLTPVANPFTGVVVAEVLEVEKHPEADKLRICQVNVGGSKPLLIVCGAANVRAGLKVPAALEGAELGNNFKISRSKIRGVESNGMLCSAQELGLMEQSDGLLELPQEAPVGKNLWDYLTLADYVMDVAITPNRGDCLSVMGMAKEISALTEAKINMPTISPIKPAIKDVFPIKISAPNECPHYVGRVIRQVKADAETPIWMQERLRRSGQRCISPVVDVMNYVMLELGQPMHAFDLKTLSGGIEVRLAKANEEIALLDGQTVKLDPNTLLIADEKNPLAIAGVMGGLDSSVTLLTTDIFLESAYFKPERVARAGRKYILNSESSYRFERGIDPTLQVLAIERATQLLLDIVGGQPGPVIEVADKKSLPQPIVIALTKEKITTMLGLDIADDKITSILQRLGFTCEKNKTGWDVTVPARRSDISIAVDLIEEIARVNGYDFIPTQLSISKMLMNPCPESQIATALIRQTMCDLGFNEVISYSFVDKKIQLLFDPERTAKELLNPITAEMSVMRTNLWPGLVNTLLYNQNRQQSRVRIFEIGLRFIQKDGGLDQERVLSGLISGSAFPEQWGVPLRHCDFFDLKGDVQNLLKLTHNEQEFSFRPGSHPALHPGQTAEIHRNGQMIGVIGALHPAVMQALDVQNKVYVFEMLCEPLQTARVPRSAEISKFPEIRRDIAILVDQTVPAQRIQDTISEVAGELLKEVRVFDLYQGKGIAPEQKSIALALTLQHASRTLVDEEVAELMERVLSALQNRFAAELRG